MAKFDNVIADAIKANFEAGDQPTAVNFADWIDDIQEGIEDHDHSGAGDPGGGSGMQALGSTAGPLTLTVANDGLHILDTDDDFDLIITPGSDLSADRILTLTTGDAARTVTLSGNPTLDDWFDQDVQQAASPTFADVFVPDGGIVGIAANERIVFNAAGNIQVLGADFGIGLAPAVRLDVLSNAAGYAAKIFNDGNTVNHHGLEVWCGLDLNPAERLVSFADGNGTTIGYVIGSGAGGVTYFSVSDERFKNILGLVDKDLAMKALVKVDPIRYTGKKGTQKNIGFSAQALHKYFPEVATYDKKEDLYGISYARLVPVLWAQNQALLARLEAGGL